MYDEMITLLASVADRHLTGCALCGSSARLTRRMWMVWVMRHTAPDGYSRTAETFPYREDSARHRRVCARRRRRKDVSGDDETAGRMAITRVECAGPLAARDGRLAHAPACRCGHGRRRCAADRGGRRAGFDGSGGGATAAGGVPCAAHRDPDGDGHCDCERDGDTQADGHRDTQARAQDAAAATCAAATTARAACATSTARQLVWRHRH